MKGHGGGSRLWRAWTAVLLALISAVIFVLLASDERPASAQTPPDPIARAWGNNSHGQLGNTGTLRIRQAPVTGENNQGVLGSAASLEGGQNHSLALKDGMVYAWGNNDSGQLGNGSSVSQSTTPVKVKDPNDPNGGPLTNVVAVGVGNNHNLAIRSDGTVWAWGNNNSGQLGYDPDPNTSTLENSSVPGQVSGLTNVVAVAGGLHHSLAVQSDGTVWAWGNNNFGQLGYDPDPNTSTLENSSVPGQVRGVGDTSFLTGVSDVAAGGLHSLALKSDGNAVYAWGFGANGQLGNGNTNTQSATPVQVLGEGRSGFLTGVTSVAAGGNHSLALKDGMVYAWGNNDSGQLGNGSSGFNIKNTGPEKVIDENGQGFLAGVTDVAAGNAHSLAVVGTHATVWAWGHNNFGQLGIGIASQTSSSSKPVQSLQLFGATEVAAGDVHSLAVADADTTAPTTTATPSPAPNAADWNNSDITVNLNATDTGGSGVKEIVYSASGAQTIPSTTEPGDTASVPAITAEGQTTITFSARDNVLNTESPPKTSTVKLDKTLPTGSVTIDGGDAYTNDAAVSLTLSADDPSPGSGVAEMSFSNDGTTWSMPEPFATSKSWTLASGDGEKTVHVRFTDAAGNEATAQDTIELDTAAPAVQTWNPRGKKVSPRAKPTVTFSEEMDEASVEASASGRPTTFVLKKGSKVLPAAVAYTESGTTFKAVLTPARPLKRGATYTATVTTDATDAAGNALDQDPNAASGVAKTWKFTVKP